MPKITYQAYINLVGDEKMGVYALVNGWPVCEMTCNKPMNRQEFQDNEAPKMIEQMKCHEIEFVEMFIKNGGSELRKQNVKGVKVR